MFLMGNEPAREEYFRRLNVQIGAQGFTIIQVGTRIENKGWAYTIGLIESNDHPELVVAGYSLVRAADILGELAVGVAAGERLDIPGDHRVFRCGEIGTRPVHERHLQDGLMASWRSDYDSVGRYDLVRRALQIVLPDDRRCLKCQTTQPRLDQDHRVSFDGLARQQRRARPADGGRR
jgi:Domain of unknown function (DUF4262)